MGQPFNASRIVVDKEHYEVVAGVNIPMLVETFMARDDNPSFDELVALAVETVGVKALKAQPVENPPAPAAPKAAPAKPMGRMITWSSALRAMMTAILVRSQHAGPKRPTFAHYRRQRSSADTVRKTF
jgi:hypothetical protein